VYGARKISRRGLIQLCTTVDAWAPEAQELRLGRRCLEAILAEPYASPISERLTVLKKAHKLGLRTYGMLCPLLPGIADLPEQIDDLVRFVKD
jgi:DNA repair photolyase